MPYNWEVFRGRKRRRPGPVGDGTEPWHGTVNGYTHNKCSCDRCRASFMDYQRSYRRRWGIR